MKKRGFTLVELLAVIVILAIIALIAVPVFLGIINNTKKSSDKEGVNLYTDTVEKAIQKKQMSDPNFMPDKCDIKRDGNLECFSGTTSLGIVEIEMKGQVPSSGTVIIEGNNIKYENIVLNEKTYYEKKNYTSYSIGDKITYKGSDWYIIEDSPSSQDYVTLLKETILTASELGEYAYDEGDKALFDRDNTGNYNTSSIKMALDNFVSDKKMINDLTEVDNMKIRLITLDDLMDNLGYSEQEEPAPWNSNATWTIKKYTTSTPTFVYNNYGSNSYWTMTSAAYDFHYYYVNPGKLEYCYGGGGSGAVALGVRPVINLLKSAIPNQ